MHQLIVLPLLRRAYTGLPTLSSPKSWQFSLAASVNLRFPPPGTPLWRILERMPTFLNLQDQGPEKEGFHSAGVLRF